MKIYSFKNKLWSRLGLGVAVIIAAVPTAKSMISSSEEIPSRIPYTYVDAADSHLIRAVERGSLEEVKFTIKNAPTTARGLALCIAVEKNCYDIVGFLLPWCNKNSDIVQDTLRIADRHGIGNIVKALLAPEKGIDPKSILIMP